MAGKRFRGKTCVYCGGAEAETIAEHVIGRKFFAPRYRDNLPMVPACERCNTEKSRLENYTLTATPLGGNNDPTGEYVAPSVARRLEKNARLRREMAAGLTRVDGRLTVPADSATVLNLMRYVAKGLFAFHFDRPLHPNWEPMVRHVTPREEGEAVREMLSLVGSDAEMVHRDLGDGTFVYSGYRSRKMPFCSFWQFSLFGGLEWTGNPEAPGETYRSILCGTFRRPDLPDELQPDERVDWRAAASAS